jgi:hypothetical protein
LNAVLDPENPAQKFFYEYNANESASLDTSLFHCLGKAAPFLLTTKALGA